MITVPVGEDRPRSLSLDPKRRPRSFDLRERDPWARLLFAGLAAIPLAIGLCFWVLRFAMFDE